MRFSLFVLVFLVLAAILALAPPWVNRHGCAIIEASPAAATRFPDEPLRIIAEGRVATYPGAEITLSSELPAVILRLPVQEKDPVHRGDLIAELKSDDLKAQGEEAKARIAEVEANIRLLDVEVERTGKLLESHHVSKQEWDRYQWQREAQRALREARIADAHRLQAILAKTQITSPIDGVVIARHIDPGEMAVAGSPIVTIADLARTRIEAEVDEFDAGRVTRGDKAVITAEGYPAKSWNGVVEEIPETVVGRRLKPQDPARPLDTRVLMVKIALREQTLLKLGQRVDIEIFLNAQR